MKAQFFATPDEFRRWLERHHATVRELWVGFHKRGSGTPSITYPEALDEALCFGWIDGVRKSLDGDSYVNRFTPRRRGSNWSDVNTRRARELIRAGRMTPAGLAAFEARDAAKTASYSFEQRSSVSLAPAMEKRFRANRGAWRYFQSQPPGYRKTSIWWVMSAKRDETRLRRLDTLIADSAAGRRIALLRKKET